MNFLNGKKAYLSGPIENDENQFNWRIHPIGVMTELFKISVFDPFSDPKQQFTKELKEAKTNKDYNSITKIAEDFLRKDLCLVDRSDFLVAYLPKKIQTVGTIHEIINSSNAQKPTMIVCPQGKEHISSWLYGFIDHKYMFGSWVDFYVYLKEVNDGEHADDRKWHFCYGLI